MRARSAFAAGVGSAAIVAIGWQAGLGTLAQQLPTSAAIASGTTTNASGSGAGSTASSASPSSSASASAAASGTSSSSSSSSTTTSTYKDGTYTGSVVATRYGNSQVKVVISGGKITDVVVLQRQQVDSKSNQISAQATPMLKTKVLAAQSAKVSGVGGATYTSQSYLQSLQNALDQAK
jgi:uncharacterized protein with FMN-binding domain